MTTSALLAALFIGSFFHIDLGPKITSPLAYDMPPAYVSSVSGDIRADKAAPVEKITPDTAWWTLFNEPVLNQCIDEAFRRNRDLEGALAAVAQSRAAFKVARGEQRPSLNAQLDASRSYILGGAEGKRDETNLLEPAGGVSYEMDLWGKLQKATRAARENILATEAAKNTVRLSLAGEVAKNYFSLRAADRQIQIAQENLKSQQRTLDLSKYQYEQGQVSELEVRRNEALVASTAVQVQQLQLAMTQYETSLLLLMGRDPKEFAAREVPRGAYIAELPPCPSIPEGLPAELLTQRPDILQAAFNYRTALANIGSAKAAQYPTISLSGLIGNVNNSVSDMLDGPTGWAAAAGIVAPLYNGGKLEANVKKTEAAAQQALAQYYKTVQNAMKETIDAINANEKSEEVVALEIKQEEAQRRAFELAQSQYLDGMTSQLDLLDAQRSLLAVQLQLEGSRADRLNSAVGLCLALGGGWQYRAGDDLETKELPTPWKDKKEAGKKQ
ncbi:efflux transporter outer membrane subunit [Cloacibacillus porcorum]|uniref:RND transporter n=1 Tax=Cloacibacillus porcorum TaxID=1197717 RepID=A0A1B2I544_9BACT|nr:efflux transporter outer membrane subunit [Cloacibacillus porcorum]ANZ45076.1 RND transporter [Cloacibacillus porcorum]MCC8185421.1 efflux transporter outer membrane subunit [Cloacibacillus porcorum]MCI5864385.1 efflux transporter outer membrane subunit [Cloacibacillus porcorum]MDD7650131.1 efflux transporter outer membrane subunit [Cloacibacillus porcorum]MDY4094685.1 efflux transporter outer membrane subunit [Cloacibacillus porcorum]